MKLQTFFTLAFLYAVNCNAQNSVTSSGGEGIGPGGSTSFSAGQIFYSAPGNTISISEGVQQTFKGMSVSNNTKTAIVAKITAVAAVESTAVTASVFPNPATNYIVLNIGNIVPKNLSYKLFDANGRTVLTGLIQQKQIQISLPFMISGSYVLNVNQHAKLLKTFIIIKK